MKIDSSTYTVKAVLFCIFGVLIGFFPQIITWFFYILGGIIIIGSIFTMLSSLNSGDGGMMSSGSIAGILLGIFVVFLPKILTVGIAIVGGIVLSVMALTRLAAALSDKNEKNIRILNAVAGGILAVAAIVLFINPFGAVGVVRVIIGIILIIYGLYNAYITHVIKERNKNSVSEGVIDIDSFTVKDDVNKLK